MISDRKYLLKGQYDLPRKVDATGNGIKDNAITIEWGLHYNRHDKLCFTMTGGIWNRLKTDYISCSHQCYDEIRRLYRFNPLVKEMLEIWEEYHLNDMNAGTPTQEAYLAGYKRATFDMKAETKYLSYDDRVELLNIAKLNPDKRYNNYRYGSAWLHRDLPDDVIEKIESWSDRI